MIASIRGKQQSFVAMRDPIQAEQVECRSGQRDVAVLGALTTMDVHHTAIRIDVTDLQVQAFLHPQPERVDGPEVARNPYRRCSVDNAVNLRNGKYFRQAFDVLQLHLGQGLPVTLAGTRVEKLDA